MLIPITSQEALDRLLVIEAACTDNPALAHMLADEVLCRLLEYMGFVDIIEVYRRMETWNA